MMKTRGEVGERRPEVGSGGFKAGEFALKIPGRDEAGEARGQE